jgi:integrase
VRQDAWPPVPDKGLGRFPQQVRFVHLGIGHLPRFRVELVVEVKHRGPHALLHACAARLVAEGLSLKEIGDHLGHRSTSATMTYAKVNMRALREVGNFELVELSWN